MVNVKINGLNPQWTHTSHPERILLDNSRLVSRIFSQLLKIVKKKY